VIKFVLWFGFALWCASAGHWWLLALVFVAESAFHFGGALERAKQREGVSGQRFPWARPL
jgi:hypothetical protein